MTYDRNGSGVMTAHAPIPIRPVRLSEPLPPPSMVDESRPCDVEPPIDLTAVIAERQTRFAKLDTEAAMRDAYRFARVNLHSICMAMSALPNLDPLHKAQLELVGRVMGLDLHRIPRGPVLPDASDARAIRKDIADTAGIFDKFIADIAGQLVANFHGVNRKAFDGIVSDAVNDCDALGECEAAARRAERDQEYDDADF